MKDKLFLSMTVVALTVAGLGLFEMATDIAFAQEGEGEAEATLAEVRTAALALDDVIGRLPDVAEKLAASERAIQWARELFAAASYEFNKTAELLGETPAPSVEVQAYFQAKADAKYADATAIINLPL